MKNILHVILFQLIIFSLCVCLSSVAFAEEVASGTCGENLTWVFDNKGTLTISGSGEMANFSGGRTPWQEYRNDISYVQINSGVTTIGDYSFINCNNILSVNLPSGLTSIGYAAFHECSQLNSITIPSSVTNIGEYAFQWCSQLISITIPDQVNKISRCAFYGCSSLANVTLSNSITSIDYAAFTLCQSLKSISIPEGVENIGERAFHSCKNLKEIVIPKSLINIETNAFNVCNSLTDIYYLGTLRHWEKINIASNNTPLVNATVHHMGFSIAYDANGGIGTPEAQIKIPGTALTLSDTVPRREGYDFLGWATSSDATIAEYQPGGSFTIDADTTLYAMWLKPDFILPAALTEIGKEAFSGGAFTYVKLLESCVTIGPNAFADCPNLSCISIPNMKVEIDENAFGDMTGLTIFGNVGSTAQTYAQAHNFTFIPIS